MVEARKGDDERTVADAAADLSRFAESSTRLFAEQAAVLAVMTAYGMSVTAQMTGMMLGALRGPADAADIPAPEPKTAAAEPTPAAKVVPLRPVSSDAVAAAPVVSTSRKTMKTAGAKASTAKPASSKPAARKTSAAAVVANPVTAGDDLKKISGIGPRLEQVLNERGIRRYADVASMSKAVLKKLDAELGLEGRIVGDDWAGQAKALSGGKG